MAAAPRRCARPEAAGGAIQQRCSTPLPGPAWSCWGVSVRIAHTVRKKNPKINNFLRNSTVCNQFSFSCRLVLPEHSHLDRNALPLPSLHTFSTNQNCTRTQRREASPQRGPHYAENSRRRRSLCMEGARAGPGSMTTAGGPRSAAGNRLVGPELPRW